MVKLPALLNLTSEKLERHGIYLLDDGIESYLWVGSNAHPELCSLLFGEPSVSSLTAGRYCLLELENDWSKRLNAIIFQLNRFNRGVRSALWLVREDGDPMIRATFLSRLIEDRTNNDPHPSLPQWMTDLATKINTGSF